MNILITGTNGFLAKELYQYFINKNHNVTCVSKTKPYFVDLTDRNLTNNFFKNRYFDIVLHTSIVGATKEERNKHKTLIDNLLMFNNIVDNSDKFNLLFNFCSGAALVDNESIGSLREKEEKIFNSIPKNYYGLSKNIISRQISELNNVFNLRLFGCFGKFENDDRFVKNCLLKIKNKTPPILHFDREMDFFYVQDVCKVIEHISSSYNTIELPKDINLVYETKTKLSEILKVIFDLTNTDNSFILEKPQMGSPYSGNGDRLKNLNLSLNGLHAGINEVINNVF